MGKAISFFSTSIPLTDQGPTVSGLCVVPALPFLFDHPVEHAVDTIFEKAESMVFGTPESENVRNAGEIKKEL